MEAKLTLKLDKNVIDSAKKYAKEHNRSISRMVEHYFSSLLSKPDYPDKHSSLVESLSGILSEGDLEKMAREDERVKYIIKREI